MASSLIRRGWAREIGAMTLQQGGSATGATDLHSRASRRAEPKTTMPAHAHAISCGACAAPFHEWTLWPAMASCLHMPMLAVPAQASQHLTLQGTQAPSITWGPRQGRFGEGSRADELQGRLCQVATQQLLLAVPAQVSGHVAHCQCQMRCTSAPHASAAVITLGPCQGRFGEGCRADELQGPLCQVATQQLLLAVPAQVSGRLSSTGHMHSKIYLGVPSGKVR